MALLSLSRLRLATVAAIGAGALALPGLASAATLSPAAPSSFNSTPDCPVSATNTVCVWNVPADAGNLFTAADYGQCPYWAVEKYPALVLNELTSDPLTGDWDGGTWLEHATQEGLSVSSTPASGDLAVWQGTASDPVGHVAYVEAIVSGGIIVSQMDGDSAAPFPALQGTTEFISTANLSYFQATYGLSFIATGAASTTPLSYVYTAPATPVAATTTTTTVTATAAPLTVTVRNAPTQKPVKSLAKSTARRRAAIRKQRLAHRRAAKRAFKRVAESHRLDTRAHRAH